MRKAQKQQSEELINQMEEAHSQIKLYIEQNNIPLALELLKDCQTGGVTLGTLIENTEGEVILLYCCWKNIVNLFIRFIKTWSKTLTE